jgi:hypothetical protein
VNHPLLAMQRFYPYRRSGSRPLLSTWNAAVLAVVLVCIYLNFAVYAQVLKQSLLPKYFYFGFMFLLLPMLLPRAKAISAYLVSPFVLWALALLLLNLMHLLSDGEGMQSRLNQMLLTRIQTVIMVIMLGYVFSLVHASLYRWTFVFLAVLVPCIVITDFLFPGVVYSVDTVGSVVGRAAGTFINPNGACDGMLLIFLLACPVTPKRYRTPLLLLCGIGILLTFSRAGMMAWSLLWLYLLAYRRVSAVGALMVLALIVTPLAMGSLASYLNTRTELSAGISNLEQRLTFLSGKRMDDDSAQERLMVAEAGWKRFLSNPLTGIGAGATNVGFTTTWPYEVSTHNELMILAAEYGLAGIILWGWLGVMLWRGNYFQDRVMQRAGVLLFLVMTSFTHNMLEFPYWLLTFALLSQRTMQAQSEPGQVYPHAPPRYK